MKLNQDDIRRLYGDAPEDFRQRLRNTLNGLEDKRAVRRRLPAALLAAAILVVVLAGAGIAANQLDIFHLLDSASPIVPLGGAEEMVAVNMGVSENEYATLTVEGAMFDGQGVLVQCRLTPKDSANYALLNDFMQDTSESIYNIEFVPAKTEEGRWMVTEDDGSTTEVINEEGVQQLLVNGQAVEIPSTRTEANQKDLPVYREDGMIYYAYYRDVKILGRKDGRKTMDWWIYLDTDDERLSENSSDAQEQEDGSVLFWAEGYADELLDQDHIGVRIRSAVEVDGTYHELDEIHFELPKGEMERSYRLEPVGDSRLERFEMLDGSVVFTRVRGYLKLDYRYEEAEDEPMGVTMKLYDIDGNEINVGGGSRYDQDGVYRESIEMQSYAAAPERVYLEVKVIDSNKTLGRIECRLVGE